MIRNFGIAIENEKTRTETEKFRIATENRKTQTVTKNFGIVLEDDNVSFNEKQRNRHRERNNEIYNEDCNHEVRSSYEGLVTGVGIEDVITRSVMRNFGIVIDKKQWHRHRK